MLLSGNNNSLARVETSLPLMGQEHDLITIMKRTSPHQDPEHVYRIEVFVESEYKMGLTEKFTQFFADRQIGMSSLSAQTIDKAKVEKEQNQFHIALTAHVYSSDLKMLVSARIKWLSDKAPI
jgi:glycine cleavage system transcriptional repressor